ncbi:MAG TPA: hypothetical protein VM031_01375 [Phycisphaerae bacterium]|nr:hypothetical protein [Phycisphaerae bacterium]
MKHAICILTVLSAILGGCAGHHALVEPKADLLRAGVVNDPKQVSRLERAMTDRDIGNLLDVNVRAKLPTSLAIAKLRSHCSGYQPYLEKIDAVELGAWEKAVEDQALIRGVQPVSALSHASEKPTLHSLRVAAARTGCELLLVYLQSDSTVSNLNDAAVLYWTILGLWTVPGSVLEHKTVMQAILVDSRTGAILGTATGDAHTKRAYPAAFEDQRRAALAKAVPAAALADLGTGCRRLVKQVVETAVAKRPGKAGA